MKVLSIIKRFTVEKAAIIVDRLAPPPTGKLIESEKGEWMKFSDLYTLMKEGVLIEVTPELQELVLDGKSQREFVEAVKAMGYKEFDEIMDILRRNVGQLKEPRVFQVWSEGWQDNGGGSGAMFLGCATATNFNEACRILKIELGPERTKDWKCDPKTGRYSNYCGDLHDNEYDARKFFG